MEPRTLSALTAAMILANTVPEKDMEPQRWSSAKDAKKPNKDRSKTKAARKQRKGKP